MNINQRKALRLPVLGQQQDGELRIGGVRAPVQLLDQSANGFAVMTFNEPNVDIGSTGILRTGNDWCEIRIANITPMNGDEDETQCFRLGLYRLGDIVDPDFKPRYFSGVVWKNHLKQAMPASTSAIVFGLIFVFCIIVLPLSVMGVIRGWNGKTIGDSSEMTKTIASNGNNKDPNWEKLASTGQSVSSSIAKQTGDASLNQVANYANDLMKTIRGNPGASVFITPEIIQQLRISEDQQAQMRHIVDATAEMLKQLKTDIQGKINTEQYQRVEKYARESALKLLTDEQLYHWQIISGDKAKDKSSSGKADDK